MTLTLEEPNCLDNGEGSLLPSEQQNKTSARAIAVAFCERHGLRRESTAVTQMLGGLFFPPVDFQHCANNFSQH